jgi:RNA polymerase sigma-70 factor (ECF subfamily)
MTIGSEFDATLVAAQTGAEWAFATLYRDVNPPLVRYLGAQIPSGAQDLAAETWLAVARQLPAFRGGEGAFRGWVFTIARRRLIQHWRESNRRPIEPTDPEELTHAVSASDTEADALNATAAQEAVQQIRAALTSDQAEVVLLRVLAGLDVEQVAAILGKRPGAVRGLQHRAMRRLAQSFSLEALTP